MRLLSLHINGFGKLCDFSLSFDEKLTCICQQNGYGKTTISAFIKAMFYSLPTARRGQTPETNERIKYLPWNSQSFGGSLTFSLGDKTYTIIRNFDRQSAVNDVFRILDAESGKEVNGFDSKIGEEIFGVDEEGFFRSTFSNGIPALSTLPASVRTRISSENENAEDLGEFGVAKKKLDDAIKQLNGKNGELAKLKTRMFECENELARCKIDIDEYHRINAQIETINSELNRLQAQKSELEAKFTVSAGAEASKAKLDNYNKLKEEIESLANTVSSIEKRYGGKIPTDAEIDGISTLLRQIEEKEVLLASETEHSQDAEFAEIFNRFKDDLPSDLIMQELSSNANKLLLIQNKIAELSEKIDSLENELECMHLENVDKIPSEAEFYEYRLLASRMAAAPVSTSAQSKTNPLPMILAGVLAHVGVGVAFVNFTLGIVLSAVCVVVLIALLLLHSVKKTVSMGAGVPTVSNEERKKVENFLLTFGFSSQTDINVAIDKLKKAAALKSEIENNQNEMRLQQQNLNTARTYIDSIISQFEIDVQGVKGVELFVKQREKYITFVSPSLDKIKNLNTQINELYGKLVNLFKIIGLAESEKADLSKVLEDIKKDVNEYKIAIKQLDVKTTQAEESFEKDGISELNLDEKLEPLQQITDNIKRLENIISEQHDKRASLYATAQRLAQSQEEFNLYSSELENCVELESVGKEKLSILEKTLEFLNSAKTSMTQKYAVKVEECFKKYSHKFIADNIQNVSVSPELELSVKNNAIARETDFFSSGERGVMDVCLRLALVDTMFEKEKPFVILDDPFSLMDKENLSDALALVKEAANDKQIIYFTCHQSREIK